MQLEFFCERAGENVSIYKMDTGDKEIQVPTMGDVVELYGRQYVVRYRAWSLMGYVQEPHTKALYIKPTSVQIFLMVFQRG